MIVVAVCNETLHFASKVGGFEKDNIPCIRYLLEIFLTEAGVLPEITLDRDVHFHFVYGLGSGDYLEDFLDRAAVLALRSKGGLSVQGILG